MTKRMRLGMAVGLALTGIQAGVARAQDVDESAQTPGPSVERAPFGEKYYPAAAPTARRPLMQLLDRAGFADPLDDARISLFGRVEGSYTHNFQEPAGDLNLGRVFDVEHGQLLLNQIDLNVERTVAVTRDQWDVGFRIETLYGGDARFIHSNGLFDHQDFFNGPENQFDLTQAYVDVAVPLGNGVRVRAGKFLFFKQVDPNASVFYSHSFTFGGALPFTLTGITGMYNLSDQWSIEGGISRGWGQSLEDNNGTIDVLGRVRYAPSQQTSFALLFITGPELDGNNEDFRTAIDLVASHAVNDRLTLLLDVVYGTQANAPAEQVFPFDGAESDDADWYGVAGYAVYKLDDRFSVGARAEWFRDDEGFLPVLSVPTNLYEATIGVTITPFPGDELYSNLKIRPEVRYDYSDEDFFDGLTENDQFTAAIDVIFNF